MDFTLTQEQALLRDSARRYFARAPHAGAHRPDARQAWADIAEMGWLSLMVPVENGGFGGSMVDACLLAGEVGRGHVALPFVESAILGPRAFATDRQMLEQIATGEAKLAFVLDDAGCAEDTLRYEKRDGGYLLRGSRRFLRCAPDASLLVVQAFDEAGHAAVFRVPVDAPQLAMERHGTLDGAGAASIVVHALPLAADACLAAGQAATDLVEELELAACLGLAAEAVGLMDFLVDATREYTRTRRQFGQPLCGFQVVRHKLVEMYTCWQLAESLVLQAADTLDRLGHSAEACQAARAAFSYAGRQGRRVGKDAIQLHGAIGTMDELPIGHAFARLVAISQSHGGAAMQERRYAQQAVSLGDTSRLWAL